MATIYESYGVTLNATASTTYVINGTLSYTGSTAGKPLLILLPGATYNSSYWGTASAPSFVQTSVNAGYVTLNLDRLGTGLSGKPPGDQLTVGAESYGLHQVISQVLPTGGFNSITLVGHSYGSAVAITEAATYHDVSGLVLTGFSHTANPTGFAALGGNLEAAIADPANGQTLPTGYFTTAPGSRANLFYDPSTSSSAVVSQDEATKDVVAQGSFAGLSQVMNDSNLSGNITVPILGLVGANDAFFTNDSGNDFLTKEPAYYAQSPGLTFSVVPSTGHSLELSTTAPQTDGIIINWLDSHAALPTQVPEPASATMLMFAVLAFALIERRMQHTRSTAGLSVGDATQGAGVLTP